MGILITLAMIIGGLWLLIKALPIILLFLLYCVMAIPLWIAFLIFVPGFFDEGGLLLLLLIVAIVKSGGSSYSGYNYSGSDYSGSDYSGGSSYVLNKKTGVIHDRWDSSVDTISEHHRRDISYSEAQDLVNRGTRYRFKQNP